MRSILSLLTAMAVGLSLVACQTNGNQSNAQIGTAVGALAGAFIGNRLGGKNKALGTVLGAAGGALIGNAIGRMLDAEDQKRLNASTYQSLETGQPRQWYNPKSGVRARTTVKASSVERQQVQVPILKDKVKSVPPLRFIGDEYSTSHDVNVRGGPGTDYKVVDSLKGGEHVKVVGQVIGKPWYMVSRNGVGSGFVYTSLLKAAPPETTAMVAQSEPATPASQVKSATVNATSDCRVVTQQVTLGNGKSATEDVRACRGPDGWKIIS